MSGALMSNKPIESLVFAVRGQKVIIDRDLAHIYGVKTSRLNEQVKRNIARFPEDFVFQLTRNEAQTWLHSRSQIAILKPGQNIKYLPFAFTEHGAIMAANVLKSSLANQMSVFVVRAFIKMRGIATAHRELSQRLSELEKRVDMSDEKIQVILKTVRQLMAPPEKAPKKIGFHLREKRASYGKI